MLVSVIIPCYNVEDYIEECLRSVYAQSYESLEVICVDNNSTDSTLPLLNELKKNTYPDLIIASETHPGAASARNKGLAMATGEWIQFLDADDLLDESKIEHQLFIALNTEGLAFIIGGSRKIGVSGNIKSIDNPKQENPFFSVFTNIAGNTCANLWSKKNVLEAGGWDISLKSSQETDLMLRILLKKGRVKVDTEALTIIRERQEGQISQTDPILRWSRFIEVRLGFLEKLKSSYFEEWKRYYTEFMMYLLSTILILAKYDQEKALQYYHRLSIKEVALKPMYGVTRKTVLLLKLIGFSRYLKIRSVLVR